MRKFLPLMAMAFFSGFVSTAWAGDCETEVVAQCRAKSCPTYCGSLDTPEAQQACLAECKAPDPSAASPTRDRCAISLLPATDDRSQIELEAQKREQLFQCTSENRKAGSTKVKSAKKAKWKKLEAASFTARKQGTKGLTQHPSLAPKGSSGGTSSAGSTAPSGGTPTKPSKPKPSSPNSKPTLPSSPPSADVPKPMPSPN